MIWLQDDLARSVRLTDADAPTCNVSTRPERLRMRLCHGAGLAAQAACQELFVDRRRNHRQHGATAVCWLPDLGLHVCLAFSKEFRPDSRPDVRSHMTAWPHLNGENHEQKPGREEIDQKRTCQDRKGKKGGQKNKECGEIAPAIRSLRRHHRQPLFAATVPRAIRGSEHAGTRFRARRRQWTMPWHRHRDMTQCRAQCKAFSKAIHCRALPASAPRSPDG